MKKQYFLFALLLSVLMLSISCDKPDDENPDDQITYEFIDQYEILVFGSSQCFYCSDLEELMDKEQIEYTSFDTQDATHNATMWQKLHDDGYLSNQVNLPVVEITTDSVRLLIQPDLYDDIIPFITK
jgi:glutaredoxin